VIFTGLEIILIAAFLYLHISFRLYLYKIKKNSDLLQETLSTKRERNGLVARWLAPKENCSSYELSLYNDGSEKFFNIDLIIPDRYKNNCYIQKDSTILDPEADLSIFLFPSRQDFADLWIEDLIEPIILTLTYTETPLRKDYRTITIPFKINHTSKHFKAWIFKRVEEKRLEKLRKKEAK